MNDHLLARFWEPKTARILFTSLVFAVVLYFLHQVRGTLTLFLFAILFAYFTDPLIGRLSRPLRGRAYAIAAVYSLLLLSVGLALYLLGPMLANDARHLMQLLPTELNRMASGQLISQLGRSRGLDQARQEQLQDLFISHRGQILDYGEQFAQRLERPLSHLWWAILVPILSIFFLRDAPGIAAGIIRMGRDRHERLVLDGIVKDVNVMLGSYIRAQILLSALTAVVLTLVLVVLRIPYAFILGPLAGVCEFVPVVGPAIASVVIWGFAILIGYPHVLWVFLILGTWRIVQDYVTAPRIMGRSVEISPLAEIFAVLAGGEIGGVVGALVSVPVLALLRIVWKRLTNKRGIEASVSGSGSDSSPEPGTAPDAHQSG